MNEPEMASVNCKPGEQKGRSKYRYVSLKMEKEKMLVNISQQTKWQI